MEALLLQTVVLGRVKAEELGWTLSTGTVGLIEWEEQIEGHDLLPEVALIQLDSQHGFVQMLQLGQGELRWQQLEP